MCVDCVLSPFWAVRRCQQGLWCLLLIYTPIIAMSTSFLSLAFASRASAYSINRPSCTLPLISLNILSTLYRCRRSFIGTFSVLSIVVGGRSLTVMDGRRMLMFADVMSCLWHIVCKSIHRCIIKYITLYGCRVLLGSCRRHVGRTVDIVQSDREAQRNQRAEKTEGHYRQFHGLIDCINL